jgi:hypothetical protein
MRWVVEIEAGAALLFVYLANAQLRDPFPRLSGRGRAQCGFIRPHRIAGLAAFNALKDRVIDIDVLLFDPK